MPKTKTKRTPRQLKRSKKPTSKKFGFAGAVIPKAIKKFLDSTKLKGSAKDRLEFDLFMKQLQFGGKKRGGRIKK